MPKLYKRVDEKLRYHESWSTGSATVEHWGVVGDTGEVEEHPLPTDLSEEDASLQVLGPALADGFQPWDADEYSWLFVIYPIGKLTNREALDKRHAVEDGLNAVLGWTGCGECDGGSNGRESMEVACQVVDFELAKKVVTEALTGTQFGDFSAISQIPSTD